MIDSAVMTVADLLLTRRRIVLLPPPRERLPEILVRAVELELADIGFVLSARLRDRLLYCLPDELTGFRDWALRVLSAQAGGDRKHQPLFRDFPNGIPTDTLDLWWSKVLVYFLQADGQPCLFCRRSGTTHVLNPCQHVICDRCFDGSNYSACPVCEHHVDRSSPFFLTTVTPRALPNEAVRFKLLDLGSGFVEDAKAFFVSLCERRQALSPIDRVALQVLVRECGSAVLPWLPGVIPVRENMALVFGTLLRSMDAATVLARGRRYLTSATDVLRLMAVLSGKDGSLLPETLLKRTPGSYVTVPVQNCRFKVARLSRALRRALLELLEQMPEDRLMEDMLRHRSYWVWAGEFLHPGEYAARFPKTARAFAVVRVKAKDGTLASRIITWNAGLEAAIQAGNSDRMLALLGERPGELARRVDLVLRVAGDQGGDQDAARQRAVDAIVSQIHAFATPVLLTLYSHLPLRQKRAAVRVYWPKNQVALGVSAEDHRAILSASAIHPVVAAIGVELMRRFAAKPAFTDGMIDRELRGVIVPFNERTASAASVAVPRGSQVVVEPGKVARLFLHWCQPPAGLAQGGLTTDLDLSVAFYDDAWLYGGACSYYELTLEMQLGVPIARSSGDLRDAPWPDGASEFVDIDLDKALQAGFRYAVMVINAYAGLPFSALERAFAGLMLRDDTGGEYFDPRTVEWKFTLQGDNGVFMPLVFDLQRNTVHWLDVHTKGEFMMNNVELSRHSIAKICPELMTYFGSGTRASMWDLGLLHAAARCQRVMVREQGKEIACFIRQPGESASAFHQRLVGLTGNCASDGALAPSSAPMLAMLYRGDCDLMPGSVVYSLFNERILNPIAAADLLS